MEFLDSLGKKSVNFVSGLIAAGGMTKHVGEDYDLDNLGGSNCGRTILLESGFDRRRLITTPSTVLSKEMGDLTLL